MEVEPSPTSPAPLIQAEHSYSLCEEPRVQSPFTHVTSSDSFNDGKLSRRDTWGLGIFDLELLDGGGSVRYLLSGPTLSTCLPTLRKAWCVGCGEMPCREARDTFPYLRPCSLGTCSSRMVIIAFFDLVDWTAQWPFANQDSLLIILVSPLFQEDNFFFFGWGKLLITTLIRRSFLSILLIHFSMFHWPPVLPHTRHLREHPQTLVTLSCPSSMPLLRCASKAWFSWSYGRWDVLTITLLAFNWYMLHPPNSLSYSCLLNLIFYVCFLRSITSYFSTLSKFQNYIL